MSLRNLLILVALGVIVFFLLKSKRKRKTQASQDNGVVDSGSTVSAINDGSIDGYSATFLKNWATQNIGKAISLKKKDRIAFMPDGRVAQSFKPNLPHGTRIGVINADPRIFNIDGINYVMVGFLPYANAIKNVPAQILEQMENEEGGVFRQWLHQNGMGILYIPVINVMPR